MQQMKAGSWSDKSYCRCVKINPATELRNDAVSEISAFCDDVMDATLLSGSLLALRTRFFMLKIQVL